MAWAPAPYYWGGGFWGAMAIGVTSAAVYGAIVNEDTDVTYNSYEVQAGTPGATFLTTYSYADAVRPSGLVVVYGPQDRGVRATQRQRRRGGVSARHRDARPHANQRSTTGNHPSGS